MEQLREKPVPYSIWGASYIEPSAIDQMERAARLPIAVRGVLMPDAHTGYGLPIGGVLATENAVIPYAVGVDIACRMRLTVFNVSPHILGQKRDKFRKAIEDNTCFGAGGELSVRQDHPVMQDPTFNELDIARDLKDLAWRQLGSSGSGNHFVEFGTLIVHEDIVGDESDVGEGSRTFGNIPSGKYLALLSHSGSRGLGFQIANHFTQIAMSQHPELPKEYKHLAWLDMNSYWGQAYWRAMQLAGRYASANHAIIHRRITEALRLEVLGGVENHHNFAWQEEHDGRTLYVHRKGATPANLGVYGVIPGTMRDAGFVVRGKGNTDALYSASHGAGRQFSRQQAYKRFEWDEVERQLKKHGVELLSASLDETPGAYKNIRNIMAAQEDLVDIVGEFQPLLVKMDADKHHRRRNKATKKSSKKRARRQSMQDDWME
ncbi:MAG: RNA-splicing ligase RtcB [Phototrophicales bacterium]|nr:MAG: RNA-splicing ligase RtcB [Phototrophicales bacterium]